MYELTVSNFNTDIHHRRTIRLKGYDYSNPGWYFITVNLDNIRCMLACWDAGTLRLLPAGEAVQTYWLAIPLHYLNVILDEYVIMPDHLHGIIRITEKYRPCKDLSCKDVQLNVPAPLQSSNSPPNPYFAQLSPSGCSISVIIRNFKATVKRWCNQNGFPQFKWQSRFYDHIIRNEEELTRIRWYIRRNPAAKTEKYPGLEGRSIHLS